MGAGRISGKPSKAADQAPATLLPGIIPERADRADYRVSPVFSAGESTIYNPRQYPAIRALWTALVVLDRRAAAPALFWLKDRRVPSGSPPDEVWRIWGRPHHLVWEKTVIRDGEQRHARVEPLYGAWIWSVAYSQLTCGVDYERHCRNLQDALRAADAGLEWPPWWKCDAEA